MVLERLDGLRHIKVSPGFQITGDIQKALSLMENTRENIFLTGKAGTGKSSLVNLFRENTKKPCVVTLAPTGIAAIKCGGRTLHSFFHLPPQIITADVVAKNNETFTASDKLLFSLDTIIIDEISMVRADILDGIDSILRQKRNSNKPFGGVQMIFAGDLFQLPPVVNNKPVIDVQEAGSGKERISEIEYLEEIYGGIYFFNAKSFQKGNFKYIELTNIFRQKDDAYIHILNSVRNGTISDTEIAVLNQRCNPDYTINEHDERIALCGHNATVNAINTEQMNKLQTKKHIYDAVMSGKYLDPAAEIDFPADIELALKEKAPVMLVKNDRSKRWINGSLGRIIKLTADLIEVEIKGLVCAIQKDKWETIEYKYNKKTKKIIPVTAGVFSQYPIKLAWAVTIHKSQGQTFDKIFIDLEQGEFAHGQTYVALSRCTTLEGIILRQPFRREDLMIEPKIIKFSKEMETAAL